MQRVSDGVCAVVMGRLGKWTELFTIASVCVIPTPSFWKPHSWPFLSLLRRRVAQLKPGAAEAPACSLPKEPAMVTSCLQGKAINPEQAGVVGGEPRGGREGGASKWN